MPPSGDNPAIDKAVAFALVWLFLVGPILGFGLLFAGADAWVLIAVWFGGVILAAAVGYAVGKS